jgi:hypothetical protein
MIWRPYVALGYSCYGKRRSIPKMTETHLDRLKDHPMGRKMDLQKVQPTVLPMGYC